MIAEYDKERFSNRIRGEVHISADIRVSDFITEGAAYVTLTEPSLYERISQYAFQYGEDLQGMFKNEKYEYMLITEMCKTGDDCYYYGLRVR